MRTHYLSLLALAALAAGCGAQPEPMPSDAAQELVRDTGGAGEGGAAQDGGAGALKADGWGAIRGKFVVAGDVPEPLNLTIDKDGEFCGKHGLKREDLLVGSGGELENVVVFVRTRLPAGAIHEGFKERQPQDVVLDNKNCRFEPHVCLLTTKDKLVVKNSDPVQHNTKVNPVRNSAFNEATAPGASFVRQLKNREDAPASIGCNNHTWMSGWVLVREDPYVAKTGPDGTFEIEDLPAGIELEFQVWHERSPRGLEAAGGGQVQVKKGKFKARVPKDGVLDLGTLTIRATDLL
jgi:hypothetical protein